MTVGKNILIVDDDAEDRNLIKEAVNECIIPVFVTELQDGAYVLKYLQSCSPKNLPDLIIMDINMPMMSGFDVIVEVKKHHKFAGIPIYVFTTSHSNKDRAHCIQLGVADVITKPPAYADWTKKLCSFIDNRFE